MANVHEGSLRAAGKKVAIIASRYNEVITRRLVDGAVESLLEYGVRESDLDIYWVPGSFEVPQMASKLSRKKRFDGIICLGAIIRGETLHYEILSNSVLQSIGAIASSQDVPTTYGIITADTFDQAMNRAGGRNGHKGRESAVALIEMMTLWESGK